VELQEIRTTAERLKAQIGRVVVGQEAVIDLLLTALFAQAHVVLEGVPGTAKTLLARAFAAGLSLEFKRIQFTPDLMPGDVLGTNLFNFRTNEFTLTKGPIFTQILLADEINRTPPKTQAALLQAMQERQVTLDGQAHDLGAGFMVIATQNPIEQEGTYPLPEAQLDRFLFKIQVGYPSRDSERELVRLHGHRTAMPRLEELGLEALANLAFLVEARDAVAKITIREDVVDYIVDIVRATREDAAVRTGASPRAANMLASAARAYAVLQGRDFVLPDDVKALVKPALAHRIQLAPGAEIEGMSPVKVIDQILTQVPAPR
jgi:MoxR-like ATPase